jgi:hypothetical protein
MKLVYSLLVVLMAAASCAADSPKVMVPVDTADATNVRELGEQVHKIKRQARVEKASAYRRFKAHKLEGKAKELRCENCKAEQELTGK